MYLPLGKLEPSLLDKSATSLPIIEEDKMIAQGGFPGAQHSLMRAHTHIHTYSVISLRSNAPKVPTASAHLLQVVGTCSKEVSNNGQIVKVLRVHDSKEGTQPNLDHKTLVFASPTEYAQHLAQSTGDEFWRLADTDRYDEYFIQLGNGIQGGTEEESRAARQRCMHVLVGQLWMEGRIKMGQCQSIHVECKR